MNEIWIVIAIVTVVVWGVIAYEFFTTPITPPDVDINQEEVKMSEAHKLADEISFRLLATREHPDYDWLKEKLKNK